MFSPIFRAIRSVSFECKKLHKALVKILLYHDIPYDSISSFRLQIENLKKKYRFITPDDFHAFLLREREFSGLNLLVTFDDGFISSKYAAEHVLEPLGIKAFFFLTTDFIGLKNNWEEFAAKKILGGSCNENQLGPEHAPMGWEDVNWLIEHGNVIGSHSVNHKWLSDLNKEELDYEIFESAIKLEKLLGVSVDSFAFPFGDIGSIDVNALEVIQKRYKFCYSGLRGFNKRTTFPHAILRDEISLNYPADYTEFIMENGLGWRYALQVRHLSKMGSCFNNNTVASH